MLFLSFEQTKNKDIAKFLNIDFWNTIVVYKNNFQSLYKATKIIGFILIVQIILGILTLLSGAQMIVSSMHQISSIFLVSSSIYFVYLNFFLYIKV